MLMWKKLTIIILISMSFLFLAEKGSDYLMKRYPKLKSSYISQVEIKADILIIGACEAEMMLSPKMFDSATGYKTYNLGEVGTRFADNYLYLHQYLKYQNHPKYVVLHISPESFYHVDNKLLTTYKHEAFLSDTLVYNVIKELDPEYINFSNIPFLKYSFYNIFTLYKIVDAAGYSVLNKKNPPSIDGFSSPLSSDTVNSSESLVYKVQHYQWSPIEEKYFLKILTLCRNNNIQLILYKLPTYKGYYDANVELSKYDEKIVQLASQYQLPYFTYDTSTLTTDYKNFFLLSNNLLSLKAIPTFNNMLIQDLKDNVFNQNLKK